jgi:L-fuconolactonase
MYFFMRIDSHQHFWRFNPQRDAWITDEMAALKRDFLPEDLLPELKTSGIDGCIAVQADQSENETLFLLDLAGRHKQIKGVVGWIDLRSAALQERLQYFSRFEKLRGFRHIAQSEPDDRFLLRSEFARGIGQLADFGYTYDLLIYPKQLPVAIELAARFPKQRFVIDHMAKPSIRSSQFEPWSGLMRKMASLPNVYCKVSGLVTEAKWTGWRANDFEPYLDFIFEAFGCDRLMFGSDWPVCLLAGNYRQVADLVFSYVGRFPADQQDRVLGLNAVAFYGVREQNGLGTSK